MNGGDLVVYDEINKELRSVPNAFESRGETVLSIVWKPWIKSKKKITPGDELADIQWGNNDRELLSAPAMCSGEIVAVNRRIALEDLIYDPAQWLLKIETE